MLHSTELGLPPVRIFFFCSASKHVFPPRRFQTLSLLCSSFPPQHVSALFSSPLPKRTPWSINPPPRHYHFAMAVTPVWFSTSFPPPSMPEVLPPVHLELLNAASLCPPTLLLFFSLPFQFVPKLVPHVNVDFSLKSIGSGCSNFHSVVNYPPRFSGLSKAAAPPPPPPVYFVTRAAPPIPSATRADLRFLFLFTRSFLISLNGYLPLLPRATPHSAVSHFPTAPPRQRAQLFPPPIRSRGFLSGDHAVHQLS